MFTCERRNKVFTINQYVKRHTGRNVHMTKPPKRMKLLQHKKREKRHCSITLFSVKCREIGKYLSAEEKINQIRQKGIFPYSYVDSDRRLGKTASPLKEDFLYYERDKHVCRISNCGTFGD